MMTVHATFEEPRECCSLQLPTIWKKRTIWRRFEDAARAYGTAEFLVFDDGRSYTYAEARRECERVAAGLWSIGVRPNARVAVWMDNGPQCVFTMLALLKLQAVKIALNTGIGAYELGYVLEKTASEFLIVGSEMPSVDKAGMAGIVRTVVEDEVECDVPGAIAWSGMMDLAGDFRVKDIFGDSDAVSDIVFTSGSTGNPKGVPLTHDMLSRSAYASCLNRKFQRGRRIFVPLPLFHVYGYVEGFLAALFVGGALLIPTCKRFDAKRSLAFMRYRHAQDVLSVPSMMIACIELLRDAPQDFPDLQSVYCSAAECPAWVWPQIRACFGVDDVITGYGMTETSGSTMQTRPTDGDEVLRRWVGRVLPAGCSGSPLYGGEQLGYRVVADDEGTPCAPGEAGQLWCRGITVMSGYIDDPQANERAFRADGWFATGDYGRFDANGYLEFLGRMGDSYKINGENVAPEFVERIVNLCPAVKNAVIVGIPDHKHGAVGAMFVERADNAPAACDEIESYCAAELAGFQIPQYVFYSDRPFWPLTCTGKVDRTRLRAVAQRMVAAGESVDGRTVHVLPRPSGKPLKIIRFDQDAWLV